MDNLKTFLNQEILPRVVKPITYQGNEVNAVSKEGQNNLTRFLFCFPDLYEVGMSHLGLKIIYGLLNEEADIWCERVFSPGTDMEALLREHDLPLFSLESQTPVNQFDFLGFTLQYEMSYTNIFKYPGSGWGSPVIRGTDKSASLCHRRRILCL